MTNADTMLVQDIRYLFQNGYKDENPRPKYADGTPAHTLSVNHRVRTYNLQTEFPICSLRPIAWKSAIKEIFAIYQNQSNKVSEFERLGCGWWKDWELEDGTIGRSYPYNLESHRPNEMKKTVVKIKRKIVSEEDCKPCTLPSFKKEKPIDDKIYFNRYVVIKNNVKKEGDNRHRYSIIQFIDNGYKMLLRSDSVGLHKCANPYERTVFNIGYLGETDKIKNFEEWEIKILKKKWAGMIKRCYSEDYKKDAPTYNNIFVHNRWHCFANFLEDVRYLPQYFLAKEEKFKDWHLDKDYYGSNAYSKDTCVFLKLKENITYARTNGCYEITDKNNQKYYDLTLAGFSHLADFDRVKLYKKIKNKTKFSDIEFSFEFLENTDEYVYRYELSRNQLNELIKNIKTNPYSRRHMISFWNWANIDKKSLVECAYETIWNVRGEFLDMMLVQRSGDMLVASGAGGINEVQYAALQMMVAKATGYKAGKFTHVVANEQIYDRHMEQAKELVKRADDQLKVRTESPFCYYDIVDTRLEFHPKSNRFYDFTIDDFKMVNYEPIKPQLTLDLGI